MFVLSLGVIILSFISISTAQVYKFGPCFEAETVKYFDLERFLGVWYEIERFPTWYEEGSQCASKRIQACGRRIEIEHSFVSSGIQYILHVNTSYAPGDEAVFQFKSTNVDPVGIPLSIIDTDYSNYSVVYGCKYNEQEDVKLLVAWIIAREKVLDEQTIEKAHAKLNSIPYVSSVYFQPVDQSEAACSSHWTAHVQAELIED